MIYHYGTRIKIFWMDPFRWLMLVPSAVALTYIGAFCVFSKNFQWYLEESLKFTLQITSTDHLRCVDSVAWCLASSFGLSFSLLTIHVSPFSCFILVCISPWLFMAVWWQPTRLAVNVLAVAVWQSTATAKQLAVCTSRYATNFHVLNDTPFVTK